MKPNEPTDIAKGFQRESGLDDTSSRRGWDRPEHDKTLYTKVGGGERTVCCPDGALEELQET